MILLLLACAPPNSDTAVGAIPPWQGTQIGEEGDSPCDVESTLWEAEDQAPEGLSFTPAELRLQIAGSFEGTLETLYQGSEDLELTLTLDGPVWWVQELDCEDQWLELEGEISLRAGELLQVEGPLRMRSTWLGLELSEGEWSGSLSPGELPADSSALSLLISGPLSPSEDSALEWVIQRPTHREAARAGTWLLSDQPAQ
ncbi:MAG: hypothetical protein ACI9VR_000960 [Cognaticolwellia sp.]|jgi:hypothetical protein